MKDAFDEAILAALCPPKMEPEPEPVGTLVRSSMGSLRSSMGSLRRSGRRLGRSWSRTRSRSMSSLREAGLRRELGLGLGLGARLRTWLARTWAGAAAGTHRGRSWDTETEIW